KPLRDLLLRSRLTVFWAADIPGGEGWRDEIVRQLAEAKCVLVVWTKVSVGKTWVREEATEGQRRKVLVSCLLDVAEPPIGFREVQAVDLRGWLEAGAPSADDAHWRKLTQQIAAIVGNAPADYEHALSIYWKLDLEHSDDIKALREFLAHFRDAAP